MSGKSSPAKLRKPLLNRVVGHGMEQVDQLLAHPDNARIHTEQQQQALAGAIDDIGYIHPVIVNRVTGRILDGHLRVALALRSGVDALPVDYVELDEADEAKALLMLDPIAAMAATDREKLDTLLRQVQSDDERVQALMADIAEREGLEYGKPAPVDDPGAQVDRKDALAEEYGTAVGQIWQLGRHRLAIGDCTDESVVASLMSGDVAALVMADPPYNVKYTGGSTNERERDDSYRDEMSDAEYTTWLKKCMANGYRFSDDRSALLLWFASAKMRCIMDGFEGAGWTARTLIVWNKLKAHYGALGAQYKHKYEPMWYCFKPGKSPRFFGETNDTTVWDFEQPRVNDLHPTMKPLELYAKCIHNHSQEGEIVLELFSGSGTTLICCEQMGRLCRATEIDPGFAAVEIKRWEDLTGDKAVLCQG